MNGAQFVHDTLEECGWEVEIADAHRGWRRWRARPIDLAHRAGTPVVGTDRIDARVLAQPQVLVAFDRSARPRSEPPIAHRPKRPRRLSK